MTKYRANITLEVDVEEVGAQYGATPDELERQIVRCNSDDWLDDLRLALVDLDDGPGITWTVERA